MRFAADTGGTFTDLVIEDGGYLHLFKAPTVTSNPVEGVLSAFSAAADAFGIDRATLLARGTYLIHGTTHAINAVITKRVAKTALLVTKGHPDVLLLREGGRQHPFDHTVRYPRAFIPRALTFEIPGRIVASGAEHDPLDETAVLAIAEQLRSRQVEAVAVCLLWSIVNPVHERRVGELLQRVLPDVAVTLSHELNPSLREYRRAIAASIDASLKPLMTRYIDGLKGAMRQAGFLGEIFMLTSEGCMVSADEVRNAPILALNSGPSTAPIGGAQVAALESRLPDAVIFDTGGTTFDVSLVRGGIVPFTQETWLGRPYQSDLTGFPSIDVKSIGAGGGSTAWVDDGGVLHIGPESAGATPGPACYAAGGTEATITDAALTLGYIDPNFFLGGRIALDLAAARQVVQNRVAEPLGLGLEEAALSMLEVWTENMVQAIGDITVNQGIDPTAASIVGGGGAAGLNAVGIAARMRCPTLIIPEIGAGLSAAGAVISSIGRNFRRLFVTSTADFDMAGVTATLSQLREEAYAFAMQAGADENETTIDLIAEARYAHQVWEIDVPVDPNKLAGAGDAESLRVAFHKEHERIFAFSDPSSAVEVIAWRAQVRCAVSKPVTLHVATTGPTPAGRPERRAYFRGLGWVRVPVLGFSTLPAGHKLGGPAIVESPFTSVVIPPGAGISRSANGNLLIQPPALQSARISARLDAPPTWEAAQ